VLDSPPGLSGDYAAAAPGDEKYVICNARRRRALDIKDRENLDCVPRKVLPQWLFVENGLVQEGYIYLRGEYKFLVPKLQAEIDYFIKF
jgi:[NiFe] hydrogenase diaphorase moiety large subunit